VTLLMTCLIEKKKKKKRSILRLSNTSLCLCLAVAVLSSSILVVPFAMATVTSNVGGDADADDVDGDASRNSFVGKWKLKEIWDDSDDDKPRKLPTNDDGKPFILTFDEPSTRNKGGRSSDDNNDNDNNDNNNKSLNLYIKIGNSMRTSVKFLDDNADNDDSSSSSSSSSSKIEVGLVMGSRMYPGEELMGLENYLSAYLPQMKFIETKQSLLVMTTTTAATAETTNDGSGGGDGGGGGGVRQAKIICEAVEEESEA